MLVVQLDENLKRIGYFSILASLTAIGISSYGVKLTSFAGQDIAETRAGTFAGAFSLLSILITIYFFIRVVDAALADASRRRVEAALFNANNVATAAHYQENYSDRLNDLAQSICKFIIFLYEVIVPLSLGVYSALVTYKNIITTFGLPLGNL